MDKFDFLGLSKIQQNWAFIFWLGVGLIPYHIKVSNTNNSSDSATYKHVNVRALFWSLTISKTSWQLKLPLIYKLRSTMWAIVNQWGGNK